MYLTLALIKLHLNIDASYTGEDNYLTFLYDVAEEAVLKSIDKTFSDIIAELGSGNTNLPKPLLHAMLLFIANMYANRESIAYGTAVEIPNSLQYLIQLYRDYKNIDL